MYILLSGDDPGDHAHEYGGDDVVAVPEPGELPPSDWELPLPNGLDGELILLFYKLALNLWAGRWVPGTCAFCGLALL